MITPAEINREYGNLDLYLFDQILKNRFHVGKKILDCGCGEGRNLPYFVNHGFEVYGTDIYASAIHMASLLFKKATFVNASIESKPFPPLFFDYILCINVLQHQKSYNQFRDCFSAMVEMTSQSGLIFIRTLLNTEDESIFFDNKFIISEVDFLNIIEQHGLTWVEPLKKEVNSAGEQLCVALLSRSSS